MSNAKNKPRPDSIPTLWGWADPVTGELLVSCRGLANPVLSYIPNVKQSHPMIQRLKEIENRKAEIAAEKEKKEAVAVAKAAKDATNYTPAAVRREAAKKKRAEAKAVATEQPVPEVVPTPEVVAAAGTKKRTFVPKIVKEQ